LQTGVLREQASDIYHYPDGNGMPVWDLIDGVGLIHFITFWLKGSPKYISALDILCAANWKFMFDVLYFLSDISTNNVSAMVSIYDSG
jgi:hypothetical protein